MTADKILYSTVPGFCAVCGRAPCACGKRVPGKSRQPEPVRLSFQRGGKGSGVTRVERIHVSQSTKEELLSRWKKRFGCGGAVKLDAVEIQGDHRDIIEAQLREEGYNVKRVGG